MYFSTALNLICNCPIKLLINENPSLDFRFMLDLDTPTQYHQESLLYYCDYNTLRNNSQTARQGNCLLLYLDNENINQLLFANFSNVIATDDIEIYNDAIVLIQKALAEENRLIKGNNILLDKLISNKPLQEIIDQISYNYGHYADILDNALNILATSSNISPPDQKIINEHKYQIIKPNVIQYLKSTGSIEKMRSSRKPVYIEDAPRNTFVYSTSIYIGDIINVGFLSLFVMQGEKLSPITLQYLQETAKLLSILMQRNSVNNTNKATYFTHLLSSMIQGTPALAASYEDRFMVFNYHLKKYKRIAVIQIKNNIPTSTSVYDLCETLKPLFPNSVYVVLDEYIVFLFSENHISDIKKSSMLNEFLKQHLLKVGVSATFENESDAKDYYDSAKAALQLGQRLDKNLFIYLYDEYKTVDIISEISHKRNLHLLCFKPLIKLIEEDNTGENSLVKTLFIYINSQFSIKKTCDELFIHRNTLYYRLEKIKEIMGCDFMDYPNLVDIGITMMILKFLNLSPVNISYDGKLEHNPH